MNLRAQCVVLTLLGALGVELVVSGVYTRYVHTWMRLPVLVTSLLFLLLAARLALTVIRHPEAHGRAPLSTWLLLVPVVAVGVVSPPALGAYAAERSLTPVADDSGYPALPARSGARPMSVGEFTGRAQWGPSLRDRPVRLTGFVSRDAAGHWFLTRLAISCCAADAVAYRVRVVGAASPPRDTWVTATGTWVDPGRTPLPRVGAPGLAVSSVRRVAAPEAPYE